MQDMITFHRVHSDEQLNIHIKSIHIDSTGGLSMFVSGTVDTLATGDKLWIGINGTFEEGAVINFTVTGIENNLINGIFELNT